jgi:anthranilate phosphoribosyltransferase
MLALSVLSGEAKERDCGALMVLVNSAACLVLAQKATTFAEGFELAASSIKSGKAIGKLEQMVKFSGGSLEGAMERYANQKK